VPTCLEHPRVSLSHKEVQFKKFGFLLKAVAPLLKTLMKPQTKLETFDGQAKLFHVTETGV